MYNSERIRAPKRCPYEGRLKTTIKTFESSEHGNSVFVERPLKFVQRAYTDVQTTMRAILGSVPITVNGEQTFEQRSTILNNRPHTYVDERILFPITHSTTACIYKPDNAKMNEFYESDPLTLQKLIGYLAGDHEWNRTTKMEITDYVVEGRASGTNQGERTLLSDAPHNYEWLLYDTPAQNIIIESRSGRFYIPTDQTESNGDYFRSIPVTRVGNTFTSSEEEIQIPAKYLSSLFKTFEYDNIHFTAAGWVIRRFDYRLSSYSAEMNSAGFAVFQQKAERGEPFRIPLQLVSVQLQQLADPLNLEVFEVGTPAYGVMKNAVTTAHAARGDALEELESVELLAPQVRFTLLRTNSLHFAGKRFGPYARTSLDDDSIRNMRTQIEEACAPIERRVYTGREEFTTPTPANQRTQATHRFDCDAAWIARDIQNKLNTEILEPSLMNYDLLTDNNKKNVSSVPNLVLPITEIDRPQAGTIVGAPSRIFQFVQGGQFDNPEYLEGLIMLEQALGTSLYIAPTTDLVVAGNDTQVRFDLGEVVADVGGVDFGDLWTTFTHFRMGMYTRHVSTDEIRFFLPAEYISNTDRNILTNEDANLYFTTLNGSLLTPADIRLSTRLTTAHSQTQLVVHNCDSYLHGGGKIQTRIFDIVVSVVEVGGTSRSAMVLYKDDEAVDPEFLFDYGTTFQFVRLPSPISNALDILNVPEATWPQITARAEHLQYDCFGDRVVGFDFKAADAILCGPISPCPQMEIRRPVNNGAITLPPRIGNYELEFTMDSTINHESTKKNIYQLTRTGPLKVQCEYLEQTGDQPEHITLNIPKFERWLVTLKDEVDVYEHTFRYGRPEFIYISHDGDLAKFNFNYRGKACPALQNADTFALFKMFDRCVHPSSSRTYEQWNRENRPYLLRWEELGLWGQVKEEQERFIIEFEPLEYGYEQQIEIYFVYENYYLESNHTGSKFTFTK